MEGKYKKVLLDLAESASMNENTAEEYLRSQGVDVESYVGKALKEIRKKDFLEKAKASIEKHQSLIQKAIKKLRNAYPENISNIESLIRQKNPAFQFRNLHELDEIQLKEILNDVEILNIIENNDNEE